MDPNLTPSNLVTCPTCSTVYVTCSSCRLLATEPCSFLKVDPRCHNSGHDNSGFISDNGQGVSGVINLDTVDPKFKSHEHMPGGPCGPGGPGTGPGDKSTRQLIIYQLNVFSHEILLVSDCSHIY